MNKPIQTSFDKYETLGDYHWQECDKHAGLRYNPALEARYRLVIDYIARLAPIDCVLDIGSGDGYLLAQIHDFTKHAIGLEYEATGLRIATQKLAAHSHVDLVQGSCYQIPVRSQSVNVAILTDVVEHLTDPDACFREIYRVLHLNGCLIVTTPKFNTNRPIDVYHVKEYTPDELQTIAQPYFNSGKMVYFWPSEWFNFYGTRIGWRLTKYLARYRFNPFLRFSDTNPSDFEQILAIFFNPNK